MICQKSRGSDLFRTELVLSYLKMPSLGKYWQIHRLGSFHRQLFQLRFLLHTSSLCHWHVSPPASINLSNESGGGALTHPKALIPTAKDIIRALGPRLSIWCVREVRLDWGSRNFKSGDIMDFNSLAYLLAYYEKNPMRGLTSRTDIRLVIFSIVLHKICTKTALLYIVLSGINSTAPFTIMTPLSQRRLRSI